MFFGFLLPLQSSFMLMIGKLLLKAISICSKYLAFLQLMGRNFNFRLRRCRCYFPFSDHEKEKQAFSHLFLCILKCLLLRPVVHSFLVQVYRHVPYPYFYYSFRQWQKETRQRNKRDMKDNKGQKGSEKSLNID